MKTLTLLFGFLLLLTFSASGQVAQQWVATYNGTGNGSDNTNKAVIDNNGNMCNGIIMMCCGQYLYNFNIIS